MSDIVYNQFWATCLELPHYSQSVATSIGFRFVWEGLISVEGLESSSLELGQIYKRTEAP